MYENERSPPGERGFFLNSPRGERRDGSGKATRTLDYHFRIRAERYFVHDHTPHLRLRHARVCTRATLPTLPFIAAELGADGALSAVLGVYSRSFRHAEQQHMKPHTTSTEASSRARSNAERCRIADGADAEMEK